jgi:hypothetical protein
MHLRNKDKGIIWIQKGIWDLRGIRQRLEGGRCSLCEGEGNTEHRFKNEKADRMIYTVNV